MGRTDESLKPEEAQGPFEDAVDIFNDQDKMLLPVSKDGKRRIPIKAIKIIIIITVQTFFCPSSVSAKVHER
ncbi:MAG: hypothetical protein IPJ40_03905 [Saprospirales bacterium]|nr:hypothetical protein [Saprospirales bacterium]